MNENDVITIFGGNGFVGRYLVRILAKTGAKINIVTRKESLNSEITMCGAVGQIACIKFSDNRERLRSIMHGSRYVVNLIGALTMNEPELEYANVTIVRKIADAAKHEKIESFLHVSALGIDSHIKSSYAKTKLKGEKALFNELQDAIILRPSLVVGPGDGFLNTFVKLARFLPILFVVGNAKQKLQPLYVGDLALCIYNALTLKNTKEIRGKILPVAGIGIYSVKEIVAMALKYLEYKRLIIELPYPLAYLNAIFFELIGEKVFSREHLNILQMNNTLSKSHNCAFALNVNPTPIQYVMSHYMP